MAVVLEEVPDGSLDGCDRRIIPAYGAVFGADGEVDLVRHYHNTVCDGSRCAVVVGEGSQTAAYGVDNVD
jgi:hypothetical protein